MVQSRGVSRASEQQRLLGKPGTRHADRAGPGYLGSSPFTKTRRLREKINLQFRAEFFNLLNHANFNTPNAVTFTPAAFRRRPA